MSSQEKQCILENFEIIGIQKVEGHSSEIGGFCLMKWSDKMLQNLHIHAWVFKKFKPLKFGGVYSMNFDQF